MENEIKANKFVYAELWDLKRTIDNDYDDGGGGDGDGVVGGCCE